MMRWAFVLGALAIGFASSNRQAEASPYLIIRWTSGFCEVWDVSSGKPFSKDYVPGRIRFKTFDAAMAKKSELIASRQCS